MLKEERHTLPGAHKVLPSVSCRRLLHAISSRVSKAVYRSALKVITELLEGTSCSSTGTGVH